jgi:hypothetical protein
VVVLLVPKILLIEELVIEVMKTLYVRHCSELRCHS